MAHSTQDHLSRFNTRWYFSNRGSFDKPNTRSNEVIRLGPLHNKAPFIKVVAFSQVAELIKGANADKIVIIVSGNDGPFLGWFNFFVKKIVPSLRLKLQLFCLFSTKKIKFCSLFEHIYLS
ncbi:hypothetical protein B9G39_29635 [Zooshikella ganghwensis]|uniref:Uncharacterized protein n=1 Tax=Zooshikella ganghwensis TaxID=202772 RepID=A0A4P9VDV9_9GAMM|nr:hypothetical protein B9G39_29635 [Zooshikella ganghwensis]